MYDLHIHSEYSMDGKFNMEDITKQAINKKGKAICFTDHINLESTSKQIDILFDIDEYIREITKVRHKYKNEIDILSGIEIAIKSHLLHRYDKLISNYNFDYVLMSIKSVDRLDIVKDNVFNKFNTKSILIKYYTEMLSCVKNFDNFDALAHIDYIDRYAKVQTGNSIKIEEYDEIYSIIEEILTELINKDKGLEVNTGSLRNGLNYLHPKPEILKMYYDLGGEIITVGSDSSDKKDLFSNYKYVEKELKKLGFKQIYIFKNRKKIPILL